MDENGTDRQDASGVGSASSEGAQPGHPGQQEEAAKPSQQDHRLKMALGITTCSLTSGSQEYL